jgi:2-dehydro-3-deoxyphosphogluconate aldolase/(4S)-4-hydroxy-2-oxoglutarate aldolase
MKNEIIESVLKKKIIAIIRGFAPDICLHLAEAFAKGGIAFVEVTFNQKSPETRKDTAAAIKAISDRFKGDVRVGAGTVLSLEQLDLCEQAGGEYMIAPNVNEALIRECVGRGLVAMPGAMTPSEAVSAHEAGADFVKIFPAGSFGSGYVKALAAPLSHIRFLAVGGVDEHNMKDYLAAGVKGFGISSSIVNKKMIESGDFDGITALARIYTDALAEARK